MTHQAEGARPLLFREADARGAPLALVPPVDGTCSGDDGDNVMIDVGRGTTRMSFCTGQETTVVGATGRGQMRGNGSHYEELQALG